MSMEQGSRDGQFASRLEQDKPAPRDQNDWRNFIELFEDEQGNLINPEEINIRESVAKPFEQAADTIKDKDPEREEFFREKARHAAEEAGLKWRQDNLTRLKTEAEHGVQKTRIKDVDLAETMAYAEKHFREAATHKDLNSADKKQLIELGCRESAKIIEPKIKEKEKQLLQQWKDTWQKIQGTNRYWGLDGKYINEDSYSRHETLTPPSFKERKNKANSRETYSDYLNRINEILIGDFSWYFNDPVKRQEVKKYIEELSDDFVWMKEYYERIITENNNFIEEVNKRIEEQQKGLDKMRKGLFQSDQDFERKKQESSFARGIKELKEGRNGLYFYLRLKESYEKSYNKVKEFFAQKDKLLALLAEFEDLDAIKKTINE